MQTEVRSEPVVVADGSGEVQVPVDLDPGREVSGRVVSAAGLPVERVTVHCDQNGRVSGVDEFRERTVRRGAYGVTDRDGRFLVRDVPLDDASFLIWKGRGVDAREVTVAVPAGLTSVADIVLPGS